MINSTLQPPLIKLEPLLDVSSSGKQRPWSEKKCMNELLASAYDSFDVGKAKRLRDCCTSVHYRQPSDGGRSVLCDAFFCRVRLCPICAWRRSLKVFSQAYSIASAMEWDNLGYSFVFLTVTAKNVYPDSLADELDNYSLAWKRFSQSKCFKRVVKGWYRGMEITHNVNPCSLNYDTYHPHLHLLLVVNKSYFSRDYISFPQWRQLWKNAARLNYDPQVNVKVVRGNLADAIGEIAKYSVEDSDYIIPSDWDLSVSSVRLLDKVLFKRRFVAFGGVMEDYHKKLHLDDTEDGDFVHIDDDPVDGHLDFKVVSYYWFSGYRQYYKLE